MSQKSGSFIKPICCVGHRELQCPTNTWTLIKNDQLTEKVQLTRSGFPVSQLWMRHII